MLVNDHFFVSIDGVYAYQNIHVKTRTDMPSQMAMQRPDSRVIRHKVHDHVSRTLIGITWLQNKGVATCGILEVGDAIPLACSFGDNPVVVAVEVHGVLASRSEAIVVDDDAH